MNFLATWTSLMQLRSRRKPPHARTEATRMGKRTSAIINRGSSPLCRARRLASLVAISGVIIGTLASTAQAGFFPSGQFGSSGSANGQFSTPEGVAVDQATGDVYVADHVNNRVERFDPTGNYLSQFQVSGPAGVAIDQATGDLYVTELDNDVVDKFDPSGNLILQFGSTGSGDGQFGSGSQLGPNSAAVDPTTGDVYVADPANSRVEKFDPNGNFLSSISISGCLDSWRSVAVDSNGNLYFVACSSVHKYDSTGNPQPYALTNFVGAVGWLTVDAAGDVFVAAGQGYGIYEYDSSGNQLDHFAVGGVPDTTFGMAFGDAHGILYVTDYYGDLGDMYQTLPPGPPAVVRESASPTGEAATSATLQGEIVPASYATTYHFEYGTTTSYGTSVPVPDGSLPGDFDVHPVSAGISGLQPRTIYHYRLVATNSAGTTDGPDRTFTTGFAITSFASQITNADGSTDTQAGSHPYQITTSFSFNTALIDGTPSLAGGYEKDIQVDLPAGLVGDPQAVPQCTQLDFQNGGYDTNCPISSVVGTAEVDRTSGSSADTRIFNLEPPPGVPAEFGMVVVDAGAKVRLDASVRTGGDYGITIGVHNITQAVDVAGSTLHFWGVPADPSHDALRGGPAGVPPKAFLTMPTACSGPLTTTMRADSWDDPGDYVSAQSVTQDSHGNPISLNGCNRLDFSPTITVQPDTTIADSPSGLSVDLHMPQTDNPDGLAEANLKTAVVTLPAGVSVNPSSANGLAACSEAQIGIDNANEPTCPDASKIGSVEVDTPLLPNPLKGSVYVAQQGSNPFESLLAIYVTAEDPVSGVLVKLAGHVVADPVTGQLTTTFDNNPQLPFTDFKLNFFGGPRGVLATPESCGTFTTTSSLTAWSGTSAVSLSDPFTISPGCVSGFSPTFLAGTTNPQAGSFSPFVLSFQRSDTDQYFSGLAVKLPPGMLAKLAGVSECSDAELAAAAANTGTAELANPSCPANSQVGTVQTGAGAGPDPYFVPGKAYLTGPYKGAPYGLAVVVPAVAGPYDLGTVVVRQALYVDPTTAQVTAVSDPFPTILQGIPLRIRRVDVNLNRPDFTLNPTSCNPMSIGALMSSTGGLGVGFTPRFQVGGCQALPFSPKLNMSLTGRGRTRSGDHPDLIATLTQRSGQANLHNAKVALPLSLALDPNNSQHVCNYDVAQAVHGGAVGCPKSTIVGLAAAQTPLLDKPLTGPVYLVQGIRFGKNGQRIRTLPSLLIPLRGQIALDLRANSSVNGAQQLVTTFSTIPDAPVSKFTLTITGGPKGLLVITGRGRTICGKKQVANSQFGAQSGKVNTQNDMLGTPCGKAAGLRHTAVKRDTVRVSVHVPGAGKLHASGKWLKSQLRRFGHAQTVTLDLHLTKAAIRRLHHKHGHLQTQVMLNWTPAGGGTHPMQTRVLTIRS